MTIRILLPLAILLAPGFAQADLYKETKQAHAENQSVNRAREKSFLADEKQLQAQRDSLLAQKQKLQSRIEHLSEQFSANEQTLADKEKKLHLEAGSLGELFGVVRQKAKELRLERDGKLTNIGTAGLQKEINQIVAAKTLPSSAQLYSLWQAYRQQIEASARLAEISVPYSGKDGILSKTNALRLGPFGLVDKNGYLKWSRETQSASHYPDQPEFAPVKGSTESLIALDPTAGSLIEQLSLKPTLYQRIEQGGGVGKIILIILATGLLIGLVQGGFLIRSRLKIHRQLKEPENIGDNALGRVLHVYNQDKSANVEALELRLYEAILDEQHKLDRGLSMIKLLAALSPMLGLLGTVTGMIETFQVITQYGNADARLMASGISTALITTVLGLISAMPLLFIHNLLSSQSESIRSVLEKQGIGLVAERAESEMEPCV